jgi:hypothetical protein
MQITHKDQASDPVMMVTLRSINGSARGSSGSERYPPIYKPLLGAFFKGGLAPLARLLVDNSSGGLNRKSRPGL